jgi:hypothetical protein
MRRVTCVGLALAVLQFAGCSASDGEVSPAPTETVTVTATATITTTAAPEVPSARKPARIGSEVTGDGVVVQMIEVDPNTPVDFEDHERWASALVKTCATVDTKDGEPLEVSWAAWQIADGQSGVYNITDVTGGLTYPLPTYPQFPQRLTKGQCVRGWVTFNVAPDAKLSQVIYGNGGADPIHWSIE